MTTLIAKPIQSKLNCSVLQPELLLGKNAQQISNIKLSRQNTVGQMFEVADISNVHELRFVGTTMLHTHIGVGLKTGQIVVQGDAGDFLGANMHGGVLVCSGNAGERVADSMRRGILLIDGNVGDYAASNLMAGTVGVLGNTGANLAYATKRGTLLLGKMPQAQATWLDCGMHELIFLKLLYRSFIGLDSQFSQINTIRVQRFMGDMSGLGKAEMLVLLNTR